MKNPKRKLTHRTFLKLKGTGTIAAIIPGQLLSACAKSSKAIPTVTGEVLPCQMGITSAHEHIQLQSDHNQREKSMAFAVSDLKRAKEFGLKTIIDVTPTRDVRGLKELVKRGYDDRMVATMDLTWLFADDKLKILWSDTNEGGEDRTYSYLLRKAVPWMKERGVPEKSVDKFILDNPRRIFTM